MTPARAQAFYFADLVLVGHDFSSSFRDDHTDFPVYTYSQTRVEPIPFASKVKHYQREVVVSVGADGTVTSVQFNASGEK